MISKLPKVCKPIKALIRFAAWLSFLLIVSGFLALAVIQFDNYPKAADAEVARARFKPSEEMARNALAAALRSWQKREKSGKIPGLENPSIVFVDNCRLQEQILERFTILGEAPGDGPRCFAVRVNLSNPEEEQRLRFVIYGIDPLWVYRYEDYEMIMHWECGREERESKAAVLKKNKE